MSFFWKEVTGARRYYFAFDIFVEVRPVFFPIFPCSDVTQAPLYLPLFIGMFPLLFARPLATGIISSNDAVFHVYLAFILSQLIITVFTYTTVSGRSQRDAGIPCSQYVGSLTNQFPLKGNYRDPALYVVINFLTFWILESYMVPISLFVTVEIVKFWQGFVFINMDPQMVDKSTGETARCRNSNLMEDLGKVDYVFSDKTGTLTCNDMRMRQIAVKGVVYGRKDVELEVDAPLDDWPTAMDIFDPNMKQARLPPPLVPPPLSFLLGLYKLAPSPCCPPPQSSQLLLLPILSPSRALCPFFTSCLPQIAYYRKHLQHSSVPPLHQPTFDMV